MESKTTIYEKYPVDQGDISRWFEEGVGCKILENDAIEIAKYLNYLRANIIYWHPGSRDRWPAFSPSRVRMAEIDRALGVLVKNLPLLIDDSVKIKPQYGATEEFKMISSTLDNAIILSQRLKLYAKRPGRPREPWHSVAKILAEKIIHAARRVGVDQIGAGKGSSRAISIISKAFEYLDVDQPPEAIADAIRPVRARDRHKQKDNR